MGYFSNSTEGMIFEEQHCQSCVHYDSDPESFGCPVWMLHMMWNYDAVGTNKDETKETALESFIPTEGIENEPCTMHFSVDAALTTERDRISNELKAAAERARWVERHARARRHGTMTSIFGAKAEILDEFATWIDNGAKLVPWNVEDGEPDASAT